MKFGVKLETYAIPEWSDKYIRYNDLKSFLKKRKKKLQCLPSAPLSFMSGGLWRRFTSKDSEDDVLPMADSLELACDDFDRLLENEVAKVEEHFYFETSFLDDRLEGVQAELDMLEEEAEENPTDKKKIRAHDAHRARLQKTIVALWECYEKLDGYAQLNHMAVYKILKKRDKEFGVKRMSGSFGLFQERFQRLRRREETSDSMRSLFSRARRVSKSDGFEVEGLAAAVQRHFMRQHRSQPMWVAFFLGVCSVIALDVIVAFSIPPANPRWTMEGFISNFPIYRLCFWFNLLIWAIGIAIFTYETFGVNYKFLLDIEPRSEINSTSVFKLASELTAFWICGFGLFFMDYRFGFFGTQSMHYWIYPLSQMLGQVLLFFLLCEPSSRRGIRKIIWETVKCSILLNPALTLTLNISGDILTSIVKPLGDIEYIMCYYTTGVFHEKPAVCSADSVLVPLFTAIPFWIRFLQCFSRFLHADKGSGRQVHVGNMGKYLMSMSVVCLTSVHWRNLNFSIYAQKLIWVLLYLCASLYSMVWDFVFDWGLIPDADNLLRSEDAMMYPDWIYYLVAALNLTGRLTWALTLIPVSLVSDQIVTNAIVYLFVGTMEIVRRTAWIIIRLENEHLTNSSSYRGMLWVPKLRVASDEESGDRNLIKDRAADEETWIRCAKKRLSRFTPLEHLKESLLNSIETHSNGGSSSPGTETPIEIPRRKGTNTKLSSRTRRAPSTFGLAMVAAQARQQLRLRRRLNTDWQPQPVRESRRRSLSLAHAKAARRGRLAAGDADKTSRWSRRSKGESPPPSPSLLAASPPISETYWCTASPSGAVRRVRREIAPGVTCVDVSLPSVDVAVDALLPSITISPVNRSLDRV